MSREAGRPDHGGRKSSRTAVTAALMRGIHTRRDRPLLIEDPWGERFVSADEQAEICGRILAQAEPEARRRLARLDSDRGRLDAVLRRHPTYGGVILRSRYAEDALAAAAARGVRQYVLLGAGLDSFCVRQPPFARALRIFEVDEPATQASKRERIATVGVAVPENVRFVAADLGRASLREALVGAGFAPAVPAFFSWLGVTIYLSREANLATLRAIAEVSAAGSELVFTYTERQALDSPAMRKMREERAARGEAWVSGFDPATVAGMLAEVGLTLLEDLDGGELTARYGAGRSDGPRAGSAGHVTRAGVAVR